MFVRFIHRKRLFLSIQMYIDWMLGQLVWSWNVCLMKKNKTTQNVCTLQETSRRVPCDMQQVAILSMRAACHLRDDNNTPYQDNNWGVSYRWPCFGNLWNLIRFYQSVKGAHAQVNCAHHVITTLRSDKRGISVWMNTWPLALYHPFIIRVLPGRWEQ